MSNGNVVGLVQFEGDYSSKFKYERWCAKKKRRRGFEPVVMEHLKSFNNVEDVVLPLRGSSKSAGYDFFALEIIVIEPGNTYFFWSDIKAYMQDNEVLKLYPRSSTGIKKSVRISNTVGIIDKDFYNNSKNNGNIGISLYNFGKTPAVWEKGEGVIQGIFEPFLESDNCNSEYERSGGIGSTN